MGHLNQQGGQGKGLYMVQSMGTPAKHNLGSIVNSYRTPVQPAMANQVICAQQQNQQPKESPLDIAANLPQQPLPKFAQTMPQMAMPSASQIVRPIPRYAGLQLGQQNIVKPVPKIATAA